MRLSIIVLSFNTNSLTKQCLASLQALEDLKAGKDFEVIVVDNGSTDGSVEMLRSEFRDFKIVEAGENLGFAKGNNLGVKHLDPTVEYVLFLNPDTVVPTGTLSEMLRYMDQTPEAGIATCKVMLASGEIDLDCHRGFPTPWVAVTHFALLDKLFPKSHMFSGYHMGWEDLNTTHEVHTAVGAFLLVRRTVGDQIGWLDEDYFLNGEDIDLCYRVHKASYKVMYHPTVTITHYRGVAKGTRKESRQITTADLSRKKMVTHATVNAMQLFYNKHYRQKNSWLKNILVDAGIFLLRQKRLLSIR